MKTWCFGLVALVSATLLFGTVEAQEEDPIGLTPTAEDSESIAKKREYSPYAGRNYPIQVYWGDTHVHTDNSLDARGFGVTLGPEEAFRFARGEEVVTSHGLRFKLSRPLDWLVVADHSDGMGAMKEIINGKKVDEVAMPEMHISTFSLSETFDVGIDSGTPVTGEYAVENHFPYTGELDKITIRLTD